MCPVQPTITEIKRVETKFIKRDKNIIEHGNSPDLYLSYNWVG